MSVRQTSLVDALVNGRYRVDGIIHRSDASVVYDATHRNGVRAWLKVPSSRDYADGILLEGNIANAVGSALKVRDDGVTDDGLPYLVLDPSEGATIATMREASGGRLDVGTTMSIAQELCAAVGAMHEAGYATSAANAPTTNRAGKATSTIDSSSVFVLESGAVGLLTLDHAVPADADAVAMDVRRVAALLHETLTSKPRTSTSSPLALASGLPRTVAVAVDDAYAGRFRTLEEFMAAFCEGTVDPLLAAERRAARSEGQTKAAPKIEKPLTPSTPMSVEVGQNADSSVIAYLKSDEYVVANAPNAPAAKPREVASPLTREFVIPRLVQATAAPVAEKKRGRSGLIIAAAFLAPVFLAVVGVGLFAMRGAASRGGASNGSTAETTAIPVITQLNGPTPTPSATPTTPSAIQPVALTVNANGAAPNGPGAVVAAVADVTNTGAGAEAQVAGLEFDDTSPAPTPKDGQPINGKTDDAKTAAPSTDAPGDAKPLDGKTGELRTSQAPDGRRVFVDGKVIGQTPLEARVPCGHHTVRIGSSGNTVNVDVPCGGSRTVRFAEGRANAD